MGISTNKFSKEYEFLWCGIIIMASEKEVLLRSSDGQEFTVREAVAVKLQTIKDMIEEDGWESLVFPVPNVDGKTLAKALEYCNKHADQEVKEEELKKFDEEFVEVDRDDLFDLLMASHFLDITKLLDLLCEKVASMIRGKTPEEIRETFDIKNDFTEEEEEKIRKQNSWAF